MTEPLGPPAKLSVRDARLSYPGRGSRPVPAVDGVSFEVAAGETLGIVGESGCGKSSLAKLIVRLARGGEGEVRLDGDRIDDRGTAAWKALRRRLQYVFQDPLGALDPRMPVLAQVREPLDIHRIGTPATRRRRASDVLDAVGIGPHLFDSAPSGLSGGQRQRVVLARALVLEPDVLLCDEPVSALDVSVQAQVLGLLSGLRERLGLTMLFISHDLAVVRHVSDRVAVLYLGRIVELGEVDPVFTRPAHPYTVALLDAVPRLDGRADRIRLAGETPSAAARPAGCAFAARCPAAQDRCRGSDPELVQLADGRRVACHFPYVLEVR